MNNNILIIGAGKVGTATGIALSNAVDFHDPYKGIAICRMLDLDYENVRKAIGLDSRINAEHSIVPSPDDGKLGFGGHCLPKDLLAIAELDQLGLFNKIKEINSMLR